MYVWSGALVLSNVLLLGALILLHSHLSNASSLSIKQLSRLNILTVRTRATRSSHPPSKF